MAVKSMTLNCRACGHEFTAPIILPMELGKAAKLLRSVHCPKCAAGARQLFCGRKPARVESPR
jgi:DNA-directed RNA polymerase subunit RPC12/RpoP